MLAYLDASALVKLVVVESESASLERWLIRRPERVSCALLQTEVLRAVGRRIPDRLDRARRLLRRVTLIDIDDDVLGRAATIEPAAIRSLDAIHLATAVRMAGELEAIVTYDRRMIAGARALGLGVASPE